MAGWMLLMGIIWWVFGIGLKGEDATWKAMAGETILLDSTAVRESGVVHTDAALPESNNDPVAAAQEIIKEVRVKASTAGNSVYSLAMIPVPATPSPIGPLGPCSSWLPNGRMTTGSSLSRSRNSTYVRSSSWHFIRTVLLASPNTQTPL